MKRLFGMVYAPLGLLFVLVCAALTSIPIWPTAVLPRGRRERYAIWGARWFAWMCLRPALFVRDTVIGLEHLPKEGGYLVVCNHRSWTDVALLMMHAGAHGISKKEMAYLPFFGLNGRLSGAIYFDRKNPLARAKVVEDAKFLLSHGANLHVFPEGTRTRDGVIKQKVHLRLVQMAFENGFHVIPACVWGTENALPSTYFGAFPFQEMGLQIAPPFSREGYTDGAAYAEAVWAKVREMARAHGADEPYRNPVVVSPASA